MQSSVSQSPESKSGSPGQSFGSKPLRKSPRTDTQIGGAPRSPGPPLSYRLTGLGPTQKDSSEEQPIDFRAAYVVHSVSSEEGSTSDKGSEEDTGYTVGRTASSSSSQTEGSACESANVAGSCDGYTTAGRVFTDETSGEMSSEGAEGGYDVAIKKGSSDTSDEVEILDDSLDGEKDCPKGSRSEENYFKDSKIREKIPTSFSSLSGELPLKRYSRHVAQAVRTQGEEELNTFFKEHVPEEEETFFFHTPDSNPPAGLPSGYVKLHFNWGLKSSAGESTNESVEDSSLSEKDNMIDRVSRQGSKEDALQLNQQGISVLRPMRRPPSRPISVYGRIRKASEGSVEDSRESPNSGVMSQSGSNSPHITRRRTSQIRKPIIPNRPPSWKSDSQQVQTNLVQLEPKPEYSPESRRAMYKFGMSQSQHNYNIRSSGMYGFSDFADDNEDDQHEEDESMADINKRFQEVAMFVKTMPTHIPPRKLTQLHLRFIQIAKDFLLTARSVGKIIISEVYLPLDKKSIKPASLGGTYYF